MRSIYLYSSATGPDRCHMYQGKLVNAKFIRYSSIPSLMKKHDIVLSEGFRSLLLGSLLKHTRLSKTHINILLGDFIISVNDRKLTRIIDKFLFENCDVFIANSSLTADFFKKTFGDKHSHKLRVCWPILKRSFLSAKPQSKDEVTNIPRICSFLYLSYLDGADMLPMIFRNIKREIASQLEMYVISTYATSVNYQKDFLREARKLGKKGFKVFIRPKPFSYDFIKNMLRKCRIFVYPARLKFFGLPVIEAMSEGLIPIVTVTTGARDFVLKIDPNLIASPDPESIAKKVVDILSLDSMELRELSSKAKEIILEWVERGAKERFRNILREFGIKL